MPPLDHWAALSSCKATVSDVLRKLDPDDRGDTAALAYLLTAYDCLVAAISALDQAAVKDPRA